MFASACAGGRPGCGGLPGGPYLTVNFETRNLTCLMSTVCTGGAMKVGDTKFPPGGRLGIGGRGKVPGGRSGGPV